MREREKGIRAEHKKDDLAAKLARLEAENLDLRRRLSESQNSSTHLEIDLPENDQRFRSIIENSPDAAYQRNLQTDRYEYLSPIIEQVLGWPLENLLSAGTPAFLERIHPEDVPTVTRSLQQAEAECRQAGHATGKVEYRFLDLAGCYRWISDQITILADSQGVPLYRLGSVRDISAAKQSQEALAQSEENYRALFETMAQGVVYQDREGKIISANPAALRLLGMSMDELRGLTSLDPRWRSIHEDGSDFPGEEHPIRVALRTKKPVTGVSMGVYIPKIEQYRWMIVSATPQFRPGESEPYQVFATFEDITERVQAESALQESENLFRELFNQHAAVELLIDPADGRIIDANLAAQEFYGWPVERLRQMKIQQINTLLLEQVEAEMQAAREQKRVHFEFVHRLANGSLRNVDVYSSTVNIKGRTLLHSIIHDVTARKQAEETLRISEERYRSLFNGITEGFALHEILCDENGEPFDYRFLDINPSFERLTGLIRDEVVGKCKSEILPNDDPYWIQTYGKVALTGQPVRFENFSSALQRHYEVFAFSPAYRQFAVLFLETTERKQAEVERERLMEALNIERELLRETNQRLNAILNSMNDIYYVLDSDWRFVEINTEAQEKFFQRPTHELIGKVLWEVYPQSLNTEIERRYRLAVAENRPAHFEVCSTIIPDAWFEAHAYPREGHLEIYLRDITERKNSEEKIANIARFPEQNPNPILRIESTGKLLFANRASQKLIDELGFRLGQAIPGVWLDLVMQVLEIQKTRLIDIPCGDTIYSLTFVPFSDSGYVNIYGQDVTDRVRNARALQKAHDELELRVQSRTEELLIANKRLQVEAATRQQAEETLRLANAYNRNLIETSLDPMMIIGMDGMVSDVNAATELITGCERDEIIGTDFYQYFTDPVRAVSAYREVLLKGSIRDFELELKHKDGSVRQVDYNAAVYRDVNGNTLGVFAAARDITLRKQAEQQIRIQTTALEAAANGVIITDVNGTILWSNPAMTQITGYNREETIGQRPSLFKSSVTAPEVYQELWQTILAGNVWHGELTNRRKDGTLYIEEETITPVRDGRGSVSHFIAVKQNVSERKRSEMELIRLNRAERLLSECNSLLIHAEEEQGLLQAICRLIIEIGGYRLAYVGFPDYNEARSIRPVALFGEEAQYIYDARISWGDNERGRGPTGTAYRESKVQVNQDFKTNQRMELWRERALKAGFQSSIALPLKDKRATFGVLTIYSATPDAFNPQEAALLTKLADNISFGMNALRERAERERAQEAARRWMHIFEHAEWGVVIGSADGKDIELMNPAYARMHGYSVEELSGRPIADLFAPDSREELARHIAMTNELGHYVFEANHIRKDGSVFPVMVDVTTVRDDYGQVLYRAVNVQDITERKAAERSLQQQEALLRTVMDNLPVGIWIIDASGRIVRSNTAGLQIWAGARYVGLEQYGEYKGWRSDTGELLTAETWAAHRAVQNDEVTLNEELEIECFDGTHKFIHNSAIPLHDDQNHLTNVVVVNHDITEIRRVQNDLIRANELLERAFASVDVMIASLDQDFNFLKVNRAFAEMEDQAPETFVGKNLFAMYPDIEIEALFRRVVETGETFTTYRQPYTNPRHPERGLIYWDCRMQPVKDPAGQVVGTVLSLADVTDQMQAEIALQESVEKYRSLVESSPDAILLTNLDHTIQFANQQALEFFGAKKLEDLLGRDVVDFFIPEDQARAEQNATSTLEQGITRNIEYTFVKLDGTRFPVELNMAVVRDARGNPMAYHKVGRDITVRKRVEKALETERQQLITLSRAERNQRLFAESLAQATAALSSSLDLNEVLDRILDQIELVAPFDAAIISLSEEETIQVARSRGFEERPAIIEELQKGVSLDDFPPLQPIFRSGETLVISDLEGTTGFPSLPAWDWVKAFIGIPLQTREDVIGSLNILYQQPQTVGQEQLDRLAAFANQASIAIQNARLYKELENSLAQEHTLRTRLIQSEKFAAMGRLLASVAHELNNPLQTIKNCLFLTREDSPAGSPVQEYLDMATSETVRLSKLVGQLRELYRPRAENVTRPYILSNILEEVHNLLQPHLAQQKVAWVLKPGCETVKVRCNLDQIKQVLINICMNGIEAMQPDGGSLTVGLSVSDDSHMVGVSFGDTGPGIAPEILKTLFEPFTTTKSSGLGLGLSICYELIQRHNGQITVDTQLGEGTTFTVWLPLLEESQTLQE